MPDYKRLVSYIYNYEDGIKRNNVGYARVEARNGQCKYTLHIAAPSLNDKQLKVYIFKRRKDGLEGILLGTFQVKNGVGDYKTVTDPVNIMNSSYGLDDMGGIILYLSGRKFFATSWDEIPITISMVAAIEDKTYVKELKAADVKEKKPDITSPGQETGTKTHEESQILKEAQAAQRQVTQQGAKEFEDYASRNEGEVFNDLDTLKVFNEREVPVPGNNTTEIKAVEVEKEKDQKAGNELNKDENRENKKENGDETDNYNEELDSPVGILQNEALIKDRSAQNDKVLDFSEIRSNSKMSKKETSDPAVKSGYEDTVVAETENKPAAVDGTGDSKVTGMAEAALNYDDLDFYEDTDSYFTPETSVEYDTNSEGVSAVPEIQRETEVGTEEEYQKNREKQPFFEDHPLAKKIYRSFPRMYPFEDNEIAWCVRIEPQDIGLFPMEAWILGNNSFLLHGYYSYRHLIFARINDKNGFGYILGVPGIYHNREKFMAKMFGFENFKCVKRKAQRTGEFGYWYIPVTLN